MNKTQYGNLENFVLKERLADENGWQRNVYHQADMSALHDIPTVTMLEQNWNRDITDFTNTSTQRSRLQLILSSVRM